MSTMWEYKIAQASSADSLETVVNEFCVDGWEPFGSMLRYNIYDKSPGNPCNPTYAHEISLRRLTGDIYAPIPRVPGDA